MGNAGNDWPPTPGLFISSHQPPPPAPPMQRHMPQHHHHPHHRHHRAGVHQRQNVYDHLVGLLTSRTNHMSTWLNNSNATLGASQNTIERTTFAHKYSTPKSSSTASDNVKKESDSGGQQRGQQEGAGTEEGKASSDRTVDDKCTICLCEYEQDENVRYANNPILSMNLIIRLATDRVVNLLYSLFNTKNLLI